MSQAAGTPRRPAERYGEHPGAPAHRRRLLAAAGALLVAAGIGYAAWVGASSAGEVRFAVQGYEHLDEAGRLQVVFTVTKPPGASAVCEVEALSSGAARVGLTSVEVPPAAQASVTVTAQVRTSERATTGRPASCVLR